MAAVQANGGLKLAVDGAPFPNCRPRDSASTEPTSPLVPRNLASFESSGDDAEEKRAGSARKSGPESAGVSHIFDGNSELPEMQWHSPTSHRGVRLTRSISLGSVPPWYFGLYGENAGRLIGFFHEGPHLNLDQRQSPRLQPQERSFAWDLPTSTPSIARYRSSPGRRSRRKTAEHGTPSQGASDTAAPRSPAGQWDMPSFDDGPIRGVNSLRSNACWSTRGYPDSDVETSPIYPHHHLRTLSAVPTSLDSSWDSETKRDSAELDFPEATVTHLADHHKPTRSSFSADDIVTRASALITEEEALFHPEQKGVTLDDLLLNNIDVRALVSELPRVVCKHSGAYWTPGQGTRSLLRFWAFNTPSTSKMNAAVPTDTLPAPLDQETPPVSRASDESEKPDPSPPDFKRHKSKSMQGLPLAQKTPNRVLGMTRSPSHQTLTFDSAVASMNANVDAYNEAFVDGKAGPMIQALLNVRGFCLMLVDQKPLGLEGLLPETLQSIADLAALAEIYKPRLQLVLNVQRYRGLVEEGRSLEKRRGTLLRIEELAMSILHDVAEERRRMRGQILQLTPEQIDILHDARQRARNSQIWLEFVMDMYKALPPERMVERIHAEGKDDDDDSHADEQRSLQREYQLEKYGAPIPIPAMFQKPYYDLWEKQRRETGDPMSFQHFLYLRILRHKDIVELAESNPRAVEDMIKEGIGNGVPEQTTITYLTTPEQRDIYRTTISNGRFYLVNLSLETRKLLDTKKYKTMWKVTGPGYAICVFREDEGIFVADHVTNRFHHSSLFAGAPVDFAGEFRVQNGRLTEINNKSGHYKPGKRETLKFLLHLQRNGVELSGVVFRFVSPEHPEGVEKDSKELLEDLMPRSPARKLSPRRADGDPAEGAAASPWTVQEEGSDVRECDVREPLGRSASGRKAAGSHFSFFRALSKRRSSAEKDSRLFTKDVIKTITHEL